MMATGSSAETLSKRAYGGTGLEVTPLCIGCAPLGGHAQTFAYSVSESDALATMRAIFNSPINFIDTAASYGDGESERRIGLVLKELGGLPAGTVLATKADRDLHSGDFAAGRCAGRSSAACASSASTGSRWSTCTIRSTLPSRTPWPPGGAVETLLSLKGEGLIEHVGLAGGPIDMSIRYVETGSLEAVITHNRYTLLNRSAEPLLELASRRGLAVVNAAPYGRHPGQGPGRLPPLRLPERPRGDGRSRAAHGRHLPALQCPLGRGRLQFSLRDPRIVSTIVGMSRPERVAQTLELARQPVPDALWPELDAVGYSSEDPEKGRWR